MCKILSLKSLTHLVLANFDVLIPVAEILCELETEAMKAAQTARKSGSGELPPQSVLSFEIYRPDIVQHKQYINLLEYLRRKQLIEEDLLDQAVDELIKVINILLK